MIKRKDGFSGERALVVPHSIIEEMEKHPLMAPLHITDIGYYPKRNTTTGSAGSR